MITQTIETIRNKAYENPVLSRCVAGGLSIATLFMVSAVSSNDSETELAAFMAQATETAYLEKNKVDLDNLPDVVACLNKIRKPSARLENIAAMIIDGELSVFTQCRMSDFIHTNRISPMLVPEPTASLVLTGTEDDRSILALPDHPDVADAEAAALGKSLLREAISDHFNETKTTESAPCGTYEMHYTSDTVTFTPAQG